MSHVEPLANFLRTQSRAWLFIEALALAIIVGFIDYLIGPFSVAGMSWKEPYFALAISAIWGIYGAVYFTRGSKKKEKSVFVQVPA